VTGRLYWYEHCGSGPKGTKNEERKEHDPFKVGSQCERRIGESSVGEFGKGIVIICCHTWRVAQSGCTSIAIIGTAPAANSAAAVSSNRNGPGLWGEVGDLYRRTILLGVERRWPNQALLPLLCMQKANERWALIKRQKLQGAEVIGFQEIGHTLETESIACPTEPWPRSRPVCELIRDAPGRTLLRQHRLLPAP